MSSPQSDRRGALRADCSRCAALCCVAPAFARSADFAVDKPAGQPCHHLQADFRCGIHAVLRESGFPGCTVFDCFGAGQQVTQVTFGGRTWRDEPQIAGPMFAVLPVMRQLHEALWHLADALSRPAAAALHDRLTVVRDDVERLTAGSPEELAGLDVGGVRRDVGELLEQVSELVRAGVRHRGPDRQGEVLIGKDLIGKDLIGKDLRRTRLAGGNLRGAYLIGADLRGADLRAADLLGADLRAADLRGADLTDALFLTQPQVEAAKGDGATVLPRPLRRPVHWRRPPELSAPAGGRTGRAPARRPARAAAAGSRRGSSASPGR
jgi:hypothetical protein